MTVSSTNTRFVQPFAQVIDLAVPKLETRIERNAKITYIDVDGTAPKFKPVYGMVMDQLPHDPSWVEVWHENFRMVNTTLDFGKTFTAYTVEGRTIRFKKPILDGLLKVYADTFFGYDLPQYTINVDNVQGAAGIAAEGVVQASYFCEPIVLTEPRYGYARLTDDRRSIIYVPEQDWEGYDTFSYTVLNDRGQLSDPKCVFITVGTPKGTPQDQNEQEDGGGE